MEKEAVRQCRTIIQYETFTPFSYFFLFSSMFEKKMKITIERVDNNIVSTVRRQRALLCCEHDKSLTKVSVTNGGCWPVLHMDVLTYGNPARI